MNRMVIGGTLLVLLGSLGFAIPVLTTQQTTDVASLGGLKLQTREVTTYPISPFLSGGVLILGVVLIGGSLFFRQR